MNEGTKKPLPCPFCGRKAKMIQPISGPNRAWNAYCTGGDWPNQDCGVVIYGRDGETKQKTAEKWNTRIGGWVSWRIRKPTEADGPQVLYAWNRLHEVHSWDFKPRLEQNEPHFWMRIPTRNTKP